MVGLDANLVLYFEFWGLPSKRENYQWQCGEKNKTNLCNKSGCNFWLFSHTHFLCWHTESVETVSVKCSDFFFVVRVRKRLHALQAGGGGGGIHGGLWAGVVMLCTDWCWEPDRLFGFWDWGRSRSSPCSLLGIVTAEQDWQQKRSLDLSPVTIDKNT